jgi:hypothetical protein
MSAPAFNSSAKLKRTSVAGRWFGRILGVVRMEIQSMIKSSFPFTEEKIRAPKDSSITRHASLSIQIRWQNMPSRNFGSNHVLFGGLAAASCESAFCGVTK